MLVKFVQQQNKQWLDKNIRNASIANREAIARFAARNDIHLSDFDSKHFVADKEKLTAIAQQTAALTEEQLAAFYRSALHNPQNQYTADFTSAATPEGIADKVAAGKTALGTQATQHDVALYLGKRAVDTPRIDRPGTYILPPGSESNTSTAEVASKAISGTVCLLAPVERGGHWVLHETTIQDGIPGKTTVWDPLNHGQNDAWSCGLRVVKEALRQANKADPILETKNSSAQMQNCFVAALQPQLNAKPAIVSPSRLAPTKSTPTPAFSKEDYQARLNDIVTKNNQAEIKLNSLSSSTLSDQERAEEWNQFWNENSAKFDDTLSDTVFKALTAPGSASLLSPQASTSCGSQARNEHEEGLVPSTPRFVSVK